MREVVVKKNEWGSVKRHVVLVWKGSWWCWVRLRRRGGDVGRKIEGEIRNGGGLAGTVSDRSKISAYAEERRWTLKTTGESLSWTLRRKVWARAC